MLIDAFLYAGEREMLELRLRTLEHVVDEFVGVVAPVTHQGERVAPSLGRDVACDVPLTMYVSHTGVPTVTSRGGVGTPDYQRIERWHRDTITAAVATATKDPAALVMVSDVDEIPAPHAIADELSLLDRMTKRCPWLVCGQRFHSTALDLLHPQQPWLGTTISRLRDLEPQTMRDARGDLYEKGCVVDRGGWHLSWFGTDAERQTKLHTFSHAELRGQFDPRAARAAHTHANGEPLHHLTLDEMQHLDWPRPLLDSTFEVPVEWWAP